MLYFAYGANLNKATMKKRCPDAKEVSLALLTDWRLVFSTRLGPAYCNIIPHRGGQVVGALWDISPNDLSRLDTYENYPTDYTRAVLPLVVDGQPVEAIVYWMTTGFRRGWPIPGYLDEVCKGYEDFKLPQVFLQKALYAAH